MIGFNEEDRKVIEELSKRGVKNGVENLRIIEKEELAEIEPNISDNVTCALYAQTGAIVCPYELTVAAIGNAMDNGTELRTNFEVMAINEIDGAYEVVSENDSIKTRYIINAAGIYADKIAKMAGDNSPPYEPKIMVYVGQGLAPAVFLICPV